MSEQVKPASDHEYVQIPSHIENDETGEVIPFDGGEVPDGFTALFRYCQPASEQKPFGYLCDWGNDSYGIQRVAFYYGEPGSATEDDWNEFPKVHNNLAVYLAPQPDYKAQRDALLEAPEEALECGEDGDWQSARRTLVAAIASVKGGA